MNKDAVLYISSSRMCFDMKVGRQKPEVRSHDGESNEGECISVHSVTYFIKGKQGDCDCAENSY